MVSLHHIQISMTLFLEWRMSKMNLDKNRRNVKLTLTKSKTNGRNKISLVN